MNNNISLKLISMEDIIKSGCFDIDGVIDVIESALTEYKAGKIMLPDKISQVFNIEDQTRINCMPSTLLSDKVCGVKWVSVFPDNPVKHNCPNVSGLIVLSETVKGYPFAVMDGTFVTAVRTACMGALGAKYLARKDCEVYGSIGSGEQAKMHFMAIKHIMPSIKVCKIAAKDGEEVFADCMKRIYPDVEFVVCGADYRKAAADADIIVTAVSCQEPLLKADSIKKGAYYCHVGGWEDEYEVALMADKIVCDQWESVKHRTQTISRLYKMGRLTDDDIYSDIVDIIDGTKPGRENDGEFIYFDSVGLSFIDISVALSFYNKIAKTRNNTDWSLKEENLFDLLSENLK